MYQQTTRHAPFMEGKLEHPLVITVQYMLSKLHLKKFAKTELDMEVQRIFVKNVQHMLLLLNLYQNPKGLKK